MSIRDELLERISKKGDIPPLPSTIQKLKELIDDPNSGINDVAQVIQSDPVLSGRLIQLANSVYFSGRGFTVTSLPRAIGRLGLKMALDIAYSVELPKLFAKVKQIDQESFWKHSMALAICSSSMAKIFGFNTDDVSHAYLGGLMHNIGVLIFVHFEPDKYSECIQNVNEDGLPRLDAELNFFQIDSSELGARFVEKWWPVAPEVVQLITTNPANPQALLTHIPTIGKQFLAAIGIPDGIEILDADQDPSFLRRYGLTDDDILNIRTEIQTALNDF
jgi:HD-like signal output (HDOD) protein